jgi:dienelactone hydrolase
MISRKMNQYVAMLLATMAPTSPAFTWQDHQYSRMGRYHGTIQETISFDVKARPMHYFMATAAGAANNNKNDRDFQDDEDDEDDAMEMLPPPPTIDGFDFEDEMVLTRDELMSMTVTQLKQQLRLRGKKVTGNKSQLIGRLLEKNAFMDVSSRRKGRSYDLLQPGYTKYEKPFASRKNLNDVSNNNKEANGKRAMEDSQKLAEAKKRGADIVDVTDFIDAEEVGKSFRSNIKANTNPIIDVDFEDATSEGSSDASSSSSSEVWGDDARIVDDYEGRSIVVDGLSRTVIEYKGSSNTIVQAYVVGSRDSLKSFLRGGQHGSAAAKSSNSDETSRDAPVYSSMEEEVYAIQTKREMESKRGLIRPDEADGQEDATDPGTSYSTIERDYGDWGVYTPTGAQLSSAEVHGVLLLSDVYGPFTDNTQALADKIAFECQPVVVLAPDLFRGKPWTIDIHLDEDGVERNEDGKTYEQWRDMHPDRRVDVDIRAAASVLRERYAVASIAVWGTCYGGGRALEAAAGWYAGGPSSYYEDAFGDRPPPPHVDPVAVVAWYPTRYDARMLFGRANEGFRTFESGKDRSVAVLAVFAQDDNLPGATPEDATLLKECLDEDSRIKDFMVKVFPDQKHGFAHLTMKDEDKEEMDRFLGENFGTIEPLSVGGDAEVACLLSTAWVETYTRVFLPTVGTPVRFDADERWSKYTLEMQRYSQKERRDVRSELEEAIANYEDVDIDLRRMSQSVSPLQDGPGIDKIEDIEEERERIRQEILDKYNISEDDDEETFERKFQQAREDGALNALLLDAYMDGEAYW